MDAAKLLDLLLLYGPVALIAGVLLLIGLTKNRRIKRRLLMTLLMAVLALLLQLLASLGIRSDVLRVIQQLLLVVGVLNAIVAVALNPFRGEGVSEHWPSILQDAIVIGGFLVVGFVIAGEQFVAIGLASSVVVGFALKDTLGNLFSGLALQTEKPFHVGDWVQVAQRAAKVEGRVMEATWRATKIRTKSGNFVVVPNSVISQDSITNYTRPSPVMRMERIVGMPSTVPPNRFKKVVLETMADVDTILKNPRPDVLTHEYEDYIIRYRCRFWIEDFGRSEPICDKFSTLLYYRLQRAGLPLPLPIRDVRITERLQEKEQPADPRMGFVQNVDLFRDLAPEIREKIASSMKRVTLAADEPVIHQGERGDSMYFIYLGAVRIILEQEGTVQEVARLESGDFFGEMALLTGEPRSATAEAVGDVEAFVLTKERFKSVLEDHPDIAESISEVIVRRREELEFANAELASHKSTPIVSHQNILSRIQRFFGLS